MLVRADGFCAFDRNSYVRNVVGGPANAAASRPALWRWSALNPAIDGNGVKHGGNAIPYTTLHLGLSTQLL
jgi:hypothetical protein